MNNPDAVKNALKDGTDPRMICMTCPWDRLCLTPPQMSAADVEQNIEKAKFDKDGQEKEDAMFSMIMSTMLFAGKDLQANLCPILTNRLHSSDGRKIADTIRTMMQEWEYQKEGKMQQSEVYLDSEHRIVVTTVDNVETIEVQRCWKNEYEPPKWFTDYANYVRLIQSAWWGSKWHHEKQEDTK